jgi:rhodanese-related sulfurtransferase
LVVDVRTDLQFDEAHIPGAVCIPMVRSGFGTKLAWVADREQDIVLVGRDDEDARRAGRLAVAVGMRKLAGFLAGGMTSWRVERRDVQHLERIGVPQLYHRRETEPDLQIVDVRERTEWDAGHIPGSHHVPYHDIHELPAQIDARRPVAAICGSGPRSAVAASLLQRHGAKHVIHVADGGVPTWGELGYDIEVAESGRAVV